MITKWAPSAYNEKNGATVVEQESVLQPIHDGDTLEGALQRPTGPPDDSSQPANAALATEVALDAEGQSKDADPPAPRPPPYPVMKDTTEPGTSVPSGTIESKKSIHDYGLRHSERKRIRRNFSEEFEVVGTPPDWCKLHFQYRDKGSGEPWQSEPFVPSREERWRVEVIFGAEFSRPEYRIMCCASAECDRAFPNRRSSVETTI